MFKDKKVLVNFTYTRCEQSSPLDTVKLAQVQQLLGSRVGREIFMYTITVDPEHDSPEALKAYAGRLGVRPGWLFLTGTRENIDAGKGQRARSLAPPMSTITMAAARGSEAGRRDDPPGVVACRATRRPVSFHRLRPHGQTLRSLNHRVLHGA